MSGMSRESKTTWRLNMSLLRWAAIVLPILFLIGFDVLRHTVFSEHLHSLAGYVGLYGFVVVAVIVFAYTMFSFIAKLERRIIEQNRQLSSLNGIAKSAASKIGLEELLGVSLDHILTSMKADAGLICLIDTERQEHSAVSHRGFSEEMIRRIQRAKLSDDRVASKVVRTGQPVVMERIFENPNVSEAVKREGIRSAISAPLKSEEEVNGILALASHTDRVFSDADKEFLAGVGGQLGMAIRNATLYEQSQLQNRELSALLAVGKVVTSTFDLDELLSTSLDTIMEVASADAAEIWLTEGDDDLAMRCHRGAHREAFLERTRFSLGEGIPGIVAQSQEPIVVNDLSQDSRFLREAVVKAGFRNFCALPLSYQSKAVGVLTVASLSANAARGQRELRLLEGIGEWLALAIENARLYQQVQDVAVLQERERIAREMHDGMAQLLGYINTQTIAVRKLLADQHINEAWEELIKMEDIARDLYADVREGILGLTTAARRDGGLLSALRHYAERYMEMSGIGVEIKASPEAESCHLAPSTEVQLIRVVQEALTNVRKHSKATAAVVTFERHDHELTVTISDNGLGFDMTRLPAKGWPRFGLQTMRERAEAVSGAFSIDTMPGQGTRVCVRIPINQR